MNTTIKHGLMEIHDFVKNDVPIIMYTDVKKYKHVPFLVNKHIDLELLFVQDGDIEMHLDDAVFHATKGDIIVANYNVLHNIIPLTDSISYECLIIDKEFCTQYDFFIDRTHIQEIIQSQEIFEHMYCIKEAMLETKKDYKIAEITAEVLQILMELFRKYTVSEQRIYDYNGREMIEKGLLFIQEHFRENISIDMIANHVGYSKFHFCRKFKEVTGCTVNTYINMQRISYAKERFLNEKSVVGEVAEESGFQNAAYFSQIFRKYVKCSPGEYKKRIAKPRH